MFELIMLVLSLLRNRDDKTPRKVVLRRRFLDPIVIFCPSCATVRVAREAVIDQYGAPGAANGWVPQARVIHCPHCTRDFPPEHFVDDGSGVLQPSTGV
jgi:hypothetical protein